MIYRGILALLVEMNLMNISYECIKIGSILLVSSRCLPRARKEGKYWCHPPHCLVAGSQLGDMMVFGETLTSCGLFHRLGLRTTTSAPFVSFDQVFDLMC